MSCKEDFGKRVRVALVWRDETTGDLAKKIGKTREAVSAVVNGRQDYPIVRKLICEELGWEVEAE